MFEIFGSVQTLLKLDSVSIDNTVFRLHYKATFIILVVSSLLVTSKQYVGDPIDCIVSDIPNTVMDTFCWIHSTFSVPSKGVQSREMPHHGIAPLSDVPKGQSVRYHKYYQWVCFTLFFQAILFYLPRYLWTFWEGGKMKILVQDLDVPIVDKETKSDRISLLVDYFSAQKNNHRFYFMKFYFCEVLNFLNIVAQIYLMDYFLGGEFTTYGTDVIAMTQKSPEERVDPMSRIFPKMAKCTFHKFGPSGTIQRFDGLCVLPLNMVNEKIYIFLWFWFLAISIVSGFQLLWRSFQILMPAIREFLLRSQCRLVPRNQVESVCSNLQLGDWFILYQLGKNIDPLIFREFFFQLNLKFEESNNRIRL